VDNCSAHRGVRAVERLRSRYPRLTLVHAPVHASWLNQIEIYFSIVQRKVLTPNDFGDLNSVAERLLDFQYYWEAAGRPFEWKFTRHPGTPRPRSKPSSTFSEPKVLDRWKYAEDFKSAGVYRMMGLRSCYFELRPGLSSL
jgi:DDE superfamily endonuclease